jgi:hypothetical protein
MKFSTYDEEHPTNFVVRLSIWHDNLEWKEIAKKFEFEILDKYNSGDLKRVPHAEEKNLRHRQTLVRFDVSKGIIWQNDEGDLVDFLIQLITRLPEKSIKNLIKKGAKLELVVGLFAPYNIDHYYPSELLLSLGKLGISLSLDYYSGPGGGIRVRNIK